MSDLVDSAQLFADLNETCERLVRLNLALQGQHAKDVERLAYLESVNDRLRTTISDNIHRCCGKRAGKTFCALAAER